MKRINWNANTEIQNNNGLTALHYACGFGRKKFVELLLQNNANIEALDNIGWSPLHWASNKNNFDIVILLIWWILKKFVTE